jgi:hypothetical protein
MYEIIYICLREMKSVICMIIIVIIRIADIPSLAIIDDRATELICLRNSFTVCLVIQCSIFATALIHDLKEHEAA